MADPQTVLTPYAVPSDRLWFDPVAVGASLAPSSREFVATGAGAELLLPANPARWGCAFMLQSGGGFNGRVLFDGRVSSSYGIELATSVLQAFNLFTYGPLVGFPWYGTFSAGSHLLIFETVRISGQVPRVRSRRAVGAGGVI